MAAVHAAQHVTHRRLHQFAIAKSDGLIGQRQSITHGTAGCPGNQSQRLQIKFNLLCRQHMLQMLHNGLGCHGSQVELQTT